MTSNQKLGEHAAGHAGRAKALALAAEERDEEAYSLLCDLVRENPADADLCWALANLCYRHNMNSQAYRLYKQVVALRVSSPRAWFQFSRCLFSLGQFGAALVAARKAAGLAPDDVEHWIHLGSCLTKTQHAAEALEVRKKAVELAPDSALAHHSLGLEFAFQGDMVSAKAALKDAIGCDPVFIPAHASLATFMSEPDECRELLATVEGLLCGTEPDSQDQSRLYFSIATLKNRLRDYDGAFEAFASGNAIERRSSEPYHREEYDGFASAIIDAFTPDVFETLKDAGNDTGQPVFVVGMPRSGTTLVSQVLSSHPEVRSAGELARMQLIAMDLLKTGDCDLKYPGDISRMNIGALRALGDDYLETLTASAPGEARRIVDKLPVNFLNLGLIAVMFPRATLVHCTRNPYDTCLSCYFQMFERDAQVIFANDLSDIAHFYTVYQRLMEHWKSVLPGRILDVRYEDLVADHEAASRSLIAHAGLDWHPDCLDFRKNSELVHSASVVQVRQPVYGSSVERWRKYEAHIGPLRDALEHAA